MDIGITGLNLTDRDLARLPVRGVAAVALRLAIRVAPIYASWSASDEKIQQMQDVLSHSTAVLHGQDDPDSLLGSAEVAYRLAAAAAADSRTRGSEQSQRAAVAGMIIHTVVDAMADIDDDRQATVINVVLAIRAASRLQDAILIENIRGDLIQLQALAEKRGQMNWTEFEPFGKLER